VIKRVIVASRILDELLEIEKRLQQEGDTEQLRKAFWKLVGKIKRLDPSKVDDEIVKKAAFIRNRLFKKKVVLNVKKGLLLFFVGCLISFAVFIYFNLCLSLDSSYMTALLFISGMTIVYFGYPLGRYLGGLIAGIKFEGFYRYSPGELGLKIEYTSYLRSRPRGRILLFGTPIFWEILLILIQLTIVLHFNPNALLGPILLLVALILSLIIIHYTMKTGELHRFIREIKITREVRFSNY